MKTTGVSSWQRLLTAGAVLTLVAPCAPARTSVPDPVQTGKTEYSSDKPTDYSPEAIPRRGEELARRNEKKGTRCVTQGRVLLDNKEWAATTRATSILAPYRER